MTIPTTPHTDVSPLTELSPFAQLVPPEVALPATGRQEPLYEAQLQITSVTEYGVALADVLAGATPPPPEGVRLDIAFEGVVTGARLAGTAVGVDHAHVRADGCTELHIHARITTADGANVALVADGVGTPVAGGVVEIREAARLHSSDPRYRWVNARVLWGTGTVDVARREIHLRAFVA
jgi:hypothetical protein